MRAVDLFEVLASITWRTIFQANRNRIVFGEDAITSINLNSIVSLNSCSIAIEDTRVVEARKGCDFELWIGSDDDGWSRYAVQAKKLTLSSRRYEQLSHKVRGRRQIDILMNYARRVRAAPIYCFYNFSPHVSTWNCALRRDEPQLGCMVTPAAVVDQALRIRRGSRNFGWMHAQPETIPWRCLITCTRDHEHKFSTRAPSRWPVSESYHHETLPPELQFIRTQGRAYQLVDPTPLRYGGDEDDVLRPRWTAIVDTGADDSLDDRAELETEKKLA